MCLWIQSTHGSFEMRVSRMSEELLRTNSDGHTSVMSNQQLSESLVNERIKSEQHRLNYERLRSLYVKLQHDLSNRTTNDLEEESKGKDADMQMDEDQPCVKSDVTKFPVKSQDPGSTQLGSAETPSQNYLSMAASNSFIRNPTSVTYLMDDRMEDVIPGMTAVPHNEILRQCSRWKELYVNLLDEFQHYKYSTDALILSNKEAVTEKVHEATQELDKIRAEQDIRVEKLTYKVDTVIRDKMILQTEIQAIREQLAEMSAKLQEKTVLCEALQRQIDEHTMGSSLEASLNLR
ncbi:unnamed protein product [Allacma fusca]|uniref:Uncharacterized protein n=1 Tax=Allacma fusca TaxID=39272 RepID=A0A8J2LBN6_9HEXA|nr:unnamed protein product [Allacma fusca]